MVLLLQPNILFHVHFHTLKCYDIMNAKHCTGLNAATFELSLVSNIKYFLVYNLRSKISTMFGKLGLGPFTRMM